MVVCAGSERDLQENLNIWETALRKRNMKTNTEKSKVITIGKTLQNKKHTDIVWTYAPTNASG